MECRPGADPPEGQKGHFRRVVEGRRHEAAKTGSRRYLRISTSSA